MEKRLKVKYECKENDCEIIVCCDGWSIDELLFRTKGDIGWTVIGYNDLRTAIDITYNAILKDQKSERSPARSMT